MYGNVAIDCSADQREPMEIYANLRTAAQRTSPYITLQALPSPLSLRAANRAAVEGSIDNTAHLAG